MDPARLTAIPVFAGLTEEQRDRLASAAGELEVEEGTVLAQEGDFGYAMFAVEHGTADVFRDGAVIRELGPGDVFGEIAILSSGRRTASVVATSPMRLLTVFNRDLWRLEEDAPELVRSLRETIGSRLRANA